MPLLRLAVIFAAVAAALALAAVASAALTPSAFRARASAVCAKGTAQDKALGSLSLNATNVEVAKYLASDVGFARQEYASLRALQPPPSLVLAHRAALWALQQVLVIADAELKKMRAGADAMKVLVASKPKADSLWRDWSGAWNAAGVAACMDGFL